MHEQAFKALAEHPQQLQGGYANHWVTKAGEKRLIEWSNTVMLDADGAMGFIVGIGIDVTEKRMAEAAIKDGYAVLKKLKSRPETREIPVIALSADAMPLDVERGLAAGFKHYLTKPVVLQELAETIGQVMQTTPAHAGAGSSILDDKKG